MVQGDTSGSAAPASVDGIPVAAMVESIVGCKWSIRLLQLCADGQSQPSAFLRTCLGLSAKVMNERLRKMLRFGIVQRTVYGDKPPIKVEYLLTPFGRRFLVILDEVRRLQEAVDNGADLDSGEPSEQTQGLSPNKAMNLTAAPLRSAAAGYRQRWAAEAKETRKHPVTREQNQEARQQG